MKHLHLLMVGLTLAIFIYQALNVFMGGTGRLSKPFMIASHIIYTLLIIAGGVMAFQLSQVIGVPMWVVAKIVLLVVAVSATIKATRPTATRVQAKAGMVIASIAYIAILALAVVKPAIGFVG